MQVFSINLSIFSIIFLQMEYFCDGFAFGKKLAIFPGNGFENYHAEEIYHDANGNGGAAQNHPASACAQHTFKQPINPVDSSAH